MGRGRPRRQAEVGAEVGTEVADVDLDISWLVPADLGAVDTLARLQVTATRHGRSLLLHGACGGLPELLAFCGFGDVVPLCACCGPRAREPEPEPGPGDDRARD